MIGNKAYRKYLKLAKESVKIDPGKVKSEALFDGKSVLITNTEQPDDQVAFKYKEFWRVERVFRDRKSLLETRPVYHQNDGNIAGHVYCSFLALVLRKELGQWLAEKNFRFEWSNIKQDLKSLKQVKIEENRKRCAVAVNANGFVVNFFKPCMLRFPLRSKSLTK